MNVVRGLYENMLVLILHIGSETLKWYEYNKSWVKAVEAYSMEAACGIRIVRVRNELVQNLHGAEEIRNVRVEQSVWVML